MATVLKDSINRIRNYQKLLEEYPESDGVDAYSRTIETEWNNIRQVYRNDEEMLVYEVEGLHEETTTYWNLSDLQWDIDDIAEDGLKFTIEIKKMRGTDIGRMRMLDI